MEDASTESSKGRPRAILAIGAHPDDIELGCGGTLAKLGAEGVPVRALIFSKGRRGAVNDEDRAIETRVALGQIGITDIHVYDFEDTKLWLNVTDLISVIEQHVRELKPFRVYTMFHQDRHQDHRAVHEASTVACRSVDQLLGYETPSSYPNFTPTVFEAIGDHIEKKVRALHSHKSQGERVYMQEEQIRSAANFRGTQIGVGPAEGFIPYKMIM